MKCKNCGAEIANNATECTFCDAPIDAPKVQQTKKVEVQVQPKTEVSVSETNNTLIGKEYVFTSSKGANLRGLLNSKIISTVKVSDDRLFIDITPKRLNVAPAILFKDITGITIQAKINFYYWFLIIVSAIGGFTAPWLFIFTAIFIFAGLDRKITISQRNGVNVVMYAGSAAEATEFKEDMKKLTKIQ